MPQRERGNNPSKGSSQEPWKVVAHWGTAGTLMIPGSAEGPGGAVVPACASAAPSLLLESWPHVQDPEE